MSIRIVVDTNSLASRNSFDKLFGNRDELGKILAIPGTELVVPAIVIDELLHQKKEAFNTAKSRMTSSAFYKQRVDSDTQSRIDSDELDVEALGSDLSIPYTAIDISDKATALEEIRNLATSYKAPFQVYKSDKDNSDKGFKDAYIALTLEEYLAQIPETESVFLLTKDARLAEYFEDNDRVVWVRNYDEISSQIDLPVAGEAVEVLVEPVGSVKPVSRERSEVRGLLTDFRNTANFATTHVLVEKLAAAVSDGKLTDADFIDVLTSTAENNQISWLLADEDVRQFIMPIFKKYGEQLGVEQYNIIAPGLGLESRKVTSTVSSAEYRSDEINSLPF